jgi:RNA polymerase sigma-70 factor, ECF subfamily
MDGTVCALPQEQALVARAQAEPKAFAAVYDHYYPRVYTYARYRVSETPVAEDLTAQIFERVLIRIGDYDPNRAPFAAWLFTIARNTVNDHLRGVQRHPNVSLDTQYHLVSPEPLPEETAVHRETNAELLAALGFLNDREREILALKFAGGLTNRRIADIVRLNEKNVSVILYRAVQRLRKRLRPEETSHD